MTTKLFTALSLLAALLLGFFLQGCVSPSCSDYVGTLNQCSATHLSTYGKKQSGACQVDQPKSCPAGLVCIKASGDAFASCIQPTEIHRTYKEIVDRSTNFCNDPFAGRQKAYVQCIASANCDLKKMNDCQDKLVNELKASEEAGLGGAFVAFALFLVVAIFLEGLLLFVLLRLIDRQNPKNAPLRAIALALGLGILTFPFVYLSPLVGIILTASVAFSLVLVVYQRDLLFGMLYSFLHIIWVWIFFSYTVATGILGGSAWLGQPATLRKQITEGHTELAKIVSDFEKEKRAEELARLRAAEARKLREEEEKKKKEEDEKKKKEEEEKKKKEEAEK